MNNKEKPYPRIKIGAAMKIWKFSNYCYRHKLKLTSKLFYFFNYVVFGCIIPPSVRIGEGSRIAHSIDIVIHPSTIIGNNCYMMHNITLGNSGIVIGDNVFLGTGCVIQGPLTIGDNVKIGANTYVNFDVPSGSTVVGVKGRII